jgi:hypothetical protein
VEGLISFVQHENITLALPKGVAARYMIIEGTTSLLSELHQIALFAVEPSSECQVFLTENIYRFARFVRQAENLLPRILSDDRESHFGT